jgi:hypothetical protein
MYWKALLSFHPVRIYSLPTMSGAEDAFDSPIRSPFQGRFFLVPVKLVSQYVMSSAGSNNTV